MVMAADKYEIFDPRDGLFTLFYPSFLPLSLSIKKLMHFSIDKNNMLQIKYCFSLFCELYQLVI
jgi:hypothetical protein